MWTYGESWDDGFDVWHTDNEEYDMHGELYCFTTSFQGLSKDEAKILVDILNKYNVPAGEANG